MTTIQSLLPIAALVLSLVACQARAPEPAAPTPPPATASGADGVADTPAESEAVAYEPAYPGEVSTEGLDAGDQAQQAAAHAHGDDEHAHGDDEHAHGDGEHAHDEHSQGDDTHTHEPGGEHGEPHPDA